MKFKVGDKVTFLGSYDQEWTITELNHDNDPYKVWLESNTGRSGWLHIDTIILIKAKRKNHLPEWL